MTTAASVRKQGPCALCGHPYARHRIVDAQMERVIAGEDIDEVAADFSRGVEEMVQGWAALMDVLSEDLMA